MDFIVSGRSINRLGKYRILEVLGEGAMGVVYKGFDPDIQRVVALKTIRGASPGRQNGLDFAERFRHEARAAGRLQHPGIVAVYEFGQDSGTDFIAMEYVAGQTLSRYLAQHTTDQTPMADDALRTIVVQLLEALGHAHDQGVWHRDIKPSNLIITPEGRIKITDFGIARLESADHTMLGALVGTPLYMAPERFLGQPIDQRVDLYAVGVLLYQLVTGLLPFTGSADALMFKAVHEFPPLPSQLPGLQHRAAFDTVLQRALAKQASQRFADAHSFRDAVVQALAAAEPVRVAPADMVAAVVPLAVAPATAPALETPTTTGHPVLWLDETCRLQLSAILAQYMGPMATVLLRRTARDCLDAPQLVSRLTAHIPDSAAQAAWQRQASLVVAPASAQARASQSPPDVQAPPVAAAHAGWDEPAFLEAAQRELARHVGPIAKLMVRKAAAQALHRDDFIVRVASQVDDAALSLRLERALQLLSS